MYVTGHTFSWKLILQIQIMVKGVVYSRQGDCLPKTLSEVKRGGRKKKKARDRPDVECRAGRGAVLTCYVLRIILSASQTTKYPGPAPGLRKLNLQF